MFEREKRNGFLFFNASGHKNSTSSSKTTDIRSMNSPVHMSTKKILNGNALRNEESKVCRSIFPESASVIHKEPSESEGIRDQPGMIKRTTTTTTRRPPPPLVDISTIKIPPTKTTLTSNITSRTEHGTVVDGPCSSGEIHIETKIVNHQNNNVRTTEEYKVSPSNAQAEQKYQNIDMKQATENLDDYTPSMDMTKIPNSSEKQFLNETVSDIDKSSINCEAPLRMTSLNNSKNEVEQQGSLELCGERKLSLSTHLGNLDSSSSSDQTESRGDLEVSSNNNKSIESNPSDFTTEFEYMSNELNLSISSSLANQDSISFDKQNDYEEDEFMSDLVDQQSVQKNYRVVNDSRARFYLYDSMTDDDTSSLTVKYPIPEYRTERRNMQYVDNYNYMKKQVPSTEKLINVDNNVPENVKQNVSLVKSASDTRSLDNSTINTTPDPPISRTASVKPNNTDKNVRLVSSYVEELRLIYFPTSNSLQLPPNLPYALKNKNTLEQPQNVKVRIRTSTRQVGIKHGKAKQKLLALETSKEEDETNETSSPNLTSYHISKTDAPKELHSTIHHGTFYSDNDQSFLVDIPGDDAYDSDDLMAPLRERPSSQPHTLSTGTRLNRSDTVSSYFTRNKGRFRSGTLDLSYVPQPSLDLRTPECYTSTENQTENSPYNDSLYSKSKDIDEYSIYPDPGHEVLHITNPDRDSE